ncbi:MAG: hypothetical protein HQL69_20520, partial [Magnetococcales bacterium]|nr:hypothetical protein [Magnetococcales bacterium]
MTEKSLDKNDSQPGSGGAADVSLSSTENDERIRSILERVEKLNHIGIA